MLLLPLDAALVPGLFGFEESLNRHLLDLHALLQLGVLHEHDLADGTRRLPHASLQAPEQFSEVLAHGWLDEPLRGHKHCHKIHPRP